MPAQKENAVENNSVRSDSSRGPPACPSPPHREARLRPGGARSCRPGCRGSRRRERREGLWHYSPASYIWAMDEEELKTFARTFLGPARVVSLKDHLLSCKWPCASCGLTVEDTIPIPVPAPCPKCNGIAFEAVDRHPQ